MTIRTSNEGYLAVLDPLPRERLGWWVEVYDAHNPATLLCHVRRFEELAFMDSRSDVGVGSVTVADNDRIFTDPLPNGLTADKILGEPSWWRVIDNGVERFRWFYEGRKFPRDDKGIRVISGRGRAAELEFGTVLPTGWPTQTKAVSRKYVAKTWAFIWLELLAEAQARGTISADVRATFTAAVDSKGQPWTDSADYEVPVGGDLLKLLDQWKESVGFEWHMAPSGYISAAAALGFNRTGSVRFYEGINIVTAEDGEDLSPLRNDVYGQAEDGTIARASDPASIGKYRRRETFVTSGAVGDITATNLSVTGTLKLLQNPIQSRTMKVPMGGRNDDGVSTGRRAFVDYAVADLIGYGQRFGDGSTDVKVISMAVKITAAGEDLEITVQSKREQLIERIQRLLARQLGGSFSPSASGGTISGIVKQIITGNTELGDLTDVDLTGATDGEAVVYDVGTGKWVAGTPSIALDDLTDVDLTGATDGDTVIRSGGVWIPGTGSGGGTQDSRWRVPAGVTSIDEFNDDSLDGAWTRVDGTGAELAKANWGEGGDALSLQLLGNDSAACLHGLMRTSTDFSVGDALVSHVDLMAPLANYFIPGIILANGATYGSGTQIRASIYYDNTVSAATPRAGMSNHTGYNTGGGASSGEAAYFARERLYFRIVKTAASTWRMDVSPNGIHWKQVGSTMSQSLTVTHVGFFGTTYGTAQSGVASFEFLRRMSGVS